MIEIWRSYNAFEFFKIAIWLFQRIDNAAAQYFWRSCLICGSNFKSRVNNGLFDLQSIGILQVVVHLLNPIDVRPLELFIIFLWYENVNH